MARQDNAKLRRRISFEKIVAGISLAGAFTIFNFAWSFRADIEKVIDSRTALLKPSNEEIRRVCKELVEGERDRFEQRDRELRATIDFIIHNYQRRR